MKYYYYIYRINFLKIEYALLLDNNIFLYPSTRVDDSNFKRQRESPSDFDDIDFEGFFQFDLSSSSLLLIRETEEVDIDKQKKEIQFIITLLSIIVSNQLFSHENYYIILDNEEITIKKALINKFKENVRNIYPSMVFIDELYFQANFNQMIKKLLGNCIFDYINDIISGLLLSLKEELFSIKLSVAWNALEHMATRYWAIKDKSKLYTLKKEKFNILIDKMNNVIDPFLENEVDEEDINIEQQYWDTWKPKQLIKGHLTKSINQFSPIKYKIKVMIENENMNIDDKLISNINKMRNWIFHNGYTFEEIEEKIKSNPNNILMRFIFTIYEKILRFIGIIDEFAESYGDQLLFHHFHNDKEKIKEEVDKISIADRDISNKNILKEIESIHTLLEDIRVKEINIQFNWRTIEQDLTMTINDDLTKVYLPQGFPREYFDFLVQNNRISIDSEEKRYDIEYASLKHEIKDLRIIFKVDCITNKTGIIKNIILNEDSLFL